MVAGGTGFRGCGRLNSTMKLSGGGRTGLSWACCRAAKCGIGIFWSSSTRSPRLLYIPLRPRTSEMQLNYYRTLSAAIIIGAIAQAQSHRRNHIGRIREIEDG